jgi:nicotinamidase/pyrazinamidase
MKVLLIVDLQNDFCPGGALAVPEGDQIVSTVNALMESGHYDLILATQDFHPVGHSSFASSHQGKEIFSQTQVAGLDQTLWPDHCVQGTQGADFHRELKMMLVDGIVQKGTNLELDSYSGFFDNARRQDTGLYDLIKSAAASNQVELRDLELHVVGLATDYCVKATAIDAAELGLKTTVLIDVCRAVNLNPLDEQNAYREMIDKGVELSSSKQILRESPRLVSREIGLSA